MELKMLQEEKEQLQTLIIRQTAIIGELEQELLKVSSNNTVLQHQHQQLLDTVNKLISTISVGSVRGESRSLVIITALRMVATVKLNIYTPLLFHHINTHCHDL